jgi:phosphatidylglycerol:prolipoprotein diacylglycerol transferase
MAQGIDLGIITIRFYGIIVMLGAVAAAILCVREARRRNLDTDYVWDGLIWVLIGGIVGARLWHIFTPQPSQIPFMDTAHYLTNPLDAIAIWNGGLGIPGGIIGGGLALYLFTRRRKLIFAEWADIAAPAVALGQAIGRWGNFFNQELYGLPTTLPWGIRIDNPVAPYTSNMRFHPLFLYESLWNLANMFFLLWMGQRYGEKLRKGDIFLLYLVGYPVGRFLLEFLRVDAAQVAGININQWVSLAVAVLAAVLLFLRHRKPVTPEESVAGEVRPAPITTEDSETSETVDEMDKVEDQDAEELEDEVDVSGNPDSENLPEEKE